MAENYSTENDLPHDEITGQPTKTTGAALIVGGGAAGIICALDLAEAGYRVHLVERASALGGHVTQYDKVFPYEKCSVCAITPKIKEAAQHANIEVLTSAELTQLSGTPGAFRARITQHPRFVDPATCTTCGECVPVCPVTIADTYNEGLSKRKAIGKLYQLAIPPTFAVVKNGHSPCKRACPLHTSVQGALDLIAAGRFAEAYAIATEANPLPSICGRVCDLACESACTRGEVDEPLAIASLLRFANEWGLEHGTPPSATVRYDERVAVIGAGPAGLAAARELALLGYRVTVFEAQPEPGGTLRYAVPEYRLPKAALASDIARIVALGVEIRTGQMAGRDFTLNGLLSESSGYRAVLLAVGLQHAQRAALPGNQLDGVVAAPDLPVSEPESSATPVAARRVVVVGDDAQAVDSARTCLRLGAASVLLMSEGSATTSLGLAQLRAAAAREGVTITSDLTAVEIVGEDRVTGVRARRHPAGQSGANGGPDSPATGKLEEAAELVEIPCDLVVLPVARQLANEIAQSDPKLDIRDGRIALDEATMATSRPGIFAAGAAAFGQAHTPVEAIATGRQAARGIHNYLRGEQLVAVRDSLMDEARPSQATLDHVVHSSRLSPPPTPQGTQLSWQEAARGFSPDAARTEAQRCLDCAVCGECNACVTACGPGALRHGARDQVLEREVGAVVAAIGFDGDDLERYAELGYGRYQNVISSFALERLLSLNGPTFGDLRRPSDNAHPRRVAFIQPWASEATSSASGHLAGLYATKEAMLAAERLGEVECDVFLNDLPAAGKGLNDFSARAEHAGVRSIVGQPSSVEEDGDTGDLIVRWIDAEDQQHTQRYDLVVLSVGLRPPRAAAALSATLGIDLDGDGFCATDPLTPVRTSRAGVFVAGAFSGPRDIPSTTAQASAAAAEVMIALADSRGTRLPASKSFPAERDVSEEPVRIGAFICRCSATDDRVVNSAETTRYASSLPDVVFATTLDFACLPEGLARIRQAIAEQQLNRVVVAGCSPRSKEGVLQGALRGAGLNPFLLEMANIREHVAWPHKDQPEQATEKAQRLVRAAVMRARLLSPLHRSAAHYRSEVLVLGGGLAGMTAALALADMGHTVHLVEQGDQLGGRALHPVLPADEARRVRQHVTALRDRLQAHDGVHVYQHTQLAAMQGFSGAFTSTLVEADGRRLHVEHGATIVATGACQERPQIYGLGTNPSVVTHVDVVRMLDEGDPSLAQARRVGIVAAAQQGAVRCTDASCRALVATALRLAADDPLRQVTVWLPAEPGRTAFLEKNAAVDRARTAGVAFVPLSTNHLPPVRLTGGTVVYADSAASDEPVEPTVDLLVLVTPTVPSPGTEELASLLRVTLTDDGFFSVSDRALHPEAHLRPIDFTREGIFVCGEANGTQSISETLSQAYGAAARAAALLSQPARMVGGSVSEVDQGTCITCLTCVRVCPIGVPVIDRQAQKAYIEPRLCKGCGICVSQCPVHAITLHHATNPQLLATQEALLTR